MTFFLTFLIAFCGHNFILVKSDVFRSGIHSKITTYLMGEDLIIYIQTSIF